MKCQALINGDKALYADVAQALRSGSGRLIHDGESALLLRYNETPRYLLGALDDAEGERLFDSIPEDEFAIIVKGKHLFEYCKSRGMRMSRPCKQIYYEGAPLDESGLLEIKRPSDEDFAAVAATYAITPQEELRRNFESDDFFAGYLDGKLVAYAGVHDDGSMGMLHVFDEYRGRGLSKQMVAHAVNNRLKKGCIPYAQVFCDNEASLTLNRGMGMIFSNDVITWAFRKR